MISVKSNCFNMAKACYLYGGGIMRIYVDFDDCLCETGRAFSKLVLEMFNKHVPYDRIHYFELDRSFDLDEEQYERLMLRGHEPEILLSFDATPGAAETINEWISCGHEVSQNEV